MTIKLNPARAVLNYRNNPTKENGEILRESLLSSNVFVPLPPESISENMTFDISRFSFMELKYDDKKAVICFTEENRIPKALKNFPFVLISFDLFYTKVMNELDRIDGVGFNPGPDLNGCFIPAQNFPIVFEDVPSRNEILDEGKVLRFAPAGNRLSEEQKENICSIVRQFPTIDHFWAAVETTDPQDIRWMLVYDGPEISDDDLVTLCHLFLKEAGEPASAGIISADSQAASGIVQEFEPVFIRTFAA